MTKEKLTLEEAHRVAGAFLSVALAGRKLEDKSETEQALWTESAAIAAAVAVLTDYHGFNLTRDRGPESESACSIVAAELGNR